MAGCNSELEGPGTGKGKGTPIQLMNYMATYTEPEDNSLAPTGLTRTWEPPTGFSLYTTTGTTALGAFFTSGTESDKRRIYYHTDDGKWYIEGQEAPATGDYNLYGYVPFNSADVDITPHTNYEQGATLTFNNMKSIMTSDICVIVGASNGTADSPTSLQEGKFSCNMASSYNYLYLLCEHLYAKIEFCFRVDNSEPYKYATLRKIKLRRVELTTYTYTLENLSDIDIMKKKGSISVSLTANNTGTSPIDGAIYFTPDLSSGDMDPVLLFEGEKELPSNTYTTETGYVPYFNLGGSGKVLYVLRSTYDVYDRYDNLIRKGCVAENTIVPQERFNIRQFNRGYKYTLQLTVMPTYLYVLSDPDLDNPSVAMD